MKKSGCLYLILSACLLRSGVARGDLHDPVFRREGSVLHEQSRLGSARN